MDYGEFLSKVIDDGIEAVKKDYTKDSQAPHLHGSVAGFEMCRVKNPVELAYLLLEAERNTKNSRMAQEDHDTYGFKRCYELEIEWVCNVVSALLMHRGLPVVINPTARGVRKAMDILLHKVPAG